MASTQRSKHTAQRVLNALFVVVYATALVPAAYIGATRWHARIMSIPASVWYLVLVSGATIALTHILWVVEKQRGELDR